MSDPLRAELRARFRETAAVRLEEMSRLLRKTPDPASLELLFRHFHALAGLGGTYGYPAISAMGDEAEAAIGPMVRSGRTPDASALARWREIVALVEAELRVP